MNFIHFDGKKIYPSKVVCIGRNYVDHITELDNEIPKEPVIFIKPNSAISQNIYTDAKEEIHYEGEITFMVESAVLVAVGFGLDLTKRKVQSVLKEKGLPWERAKSFDRSAVFSKFVSFRGEVNCLRMELYINGELKQQGGVDLMLNKPQSVHREINTFITLEDGDLMMTGTPKGVGIVNLGDDFCGKIYLNDNLLVEENWCVR